MGTLADALVNAGMKTAQAAIIERGVTDSGARPGTEEFKEALMLAGVDQHTANALSAAFLSIVPGVGTGGPVDASAVQSALSADQAGSRTALGLGSAATQPASAFATAAQGAKADTALQPGALPAGTSISLGQVSGAGSAASQPSSAFATAAQGAKADTALQPGALPAGTTIAIGQVSGAGSAASQPASAFATAAQGAKADTALQPSQASSALNLRQRRGQVFSMLGPVAVNFATASGLPAGASFSGSGSYAGQGRLAVQSTGTVTHNATGWNGTPCLEFVPNSDSAEFRIYIPAGVDWYSPDGLGIEFELPDLDVGKSNFGLALHYSQTATDLFPGTNLGYVRMFVDDNPSNNWVRNRAGKQYIRQRWDADANTLAKAGAVYGYENVGTLSGSPSPSGRITYIKIAVSNMAGKTLRFRNLYRGGKSTPAILIGSDSAGPSELFDAIAHGVSLGLKFYLDQYDAEFAANAAALAGYLAAHAAGVDVCWNDLLDRNAGLLLTDITAARNAVNGTKTALANRGFVRGEKIVVTNNNAWNQHLIQAWQEAGYVLARQGINTGQFVFPEGGVLDPYRLPAWGLDDLNWTQIKPLIDRAIQYGCTLWLYWHGVLSDARMAFDRAANVTGTVGAPLARSGTESISAYRARVAALGTAVGNASRDYFDARVGSAALGMWREELDQMLVYLAQQQGAGACVVPTPTEWAMDVGLLG